MNIIHTATFFILPHLCIIMVISGRVVLVGRDLPQVRGQRRARVHGQAAVAARRRADVLRQGPHRERAAVCPRRQHNIMCMLLLLDDNPASLSKLVFGTYFPDAPVNVKHGRLLNCHVIEYQNISIKRILPICYVVDSKSLFFY